MSELWNGNLVSTKIIEEYWLYGVPSRMSKNGELETDVISVSVL